MGIKYILSNQGLVIASVNPNIRGYQTASAKQVGGHLILITGYDRHTGTVTLHNPSGFLSLESCENHVLTIKEFKKYFAGRGIAVYGL